MPRPQICHLPNDFIYNIGDLFVLNPSTGKITLMLVINREVRIMPPSFDYKNIYIVSLHSKTLELDEDIVLPYVANGKIKVIPKGENTL